MKPFCILCNKTVDKLYDNICEDCFTEKHIHKVRLPPNIDIEICTECDAVLFKKQWRKIDGKDEKVKLFAQESIKCPKEFDLTNAQIAVSWEDEKNAFTEVRVKLKRGDILAEQNLSTRVRLRKNLCPTCSRQRGKYYEAVLQLRGTRAYDAALTVDEHMAMRGAKAFISRRVEVRGGIDFYLSDMNAAKQIAHEFSSEWGSEYRESPKLYGIKEGKTVYRMTYLVRFPEYRKGDFVIIKNRFSRIRELRKKDIRLLDMATGKEYTVNKKDMSRAKILGGGEIVQDAIVLSAVKNEMEIMDPETYKPVTLLKPEHIGLKPATVKIVKWDGQVYLLE